MPSVTNCPVKSHETDRKYNHFIESKLSTASVELHYFLTWCRVEDTINSLAQLQLLSINYNNYHYYYYYRLTLQTPGGAGVGRAGRSALVWDHVDVQDEDVRSVLPAVHHGVEISRFLQRRRRSRQWRGAGFRRKARGWRFRRRRPCRRGSFRRGTSRRVRKKTKTLMIQSKTKKN